MGCDVNDRYRRELLIKKPMAHIYEQFFDFSRRKFDGAIPSRRSVDGEDANILFGGAATSRCLAACYLIIATGETGNGQTLK
jgi:hypothetical protein